MGTNGTQREAPVRNGSDWEGARKQRVLPPAASPRSLPAMGAPPAPPPLLESLLYQSPDERRAVETICAELGLSRSCERAVAELFVSNLRSSQRLDQLEAVQFSEGYSTAEHLIRLRAIVDQKSKLQRTSLLAFQVLISTRLPAITILAGQAQVNVAGRADR